MPAARLILYPCVFFFFWSHPCGSTLLSGSTAPRPPCWRLPTSSLPLPPRCPNDDLARLAFLPKERRARSSRRGPPRIVSGGTPRTRQSRLSSSIDTGSQYVTVSLRPTSTLACGLAQTARPHAVQLNPTSGALHHELPPLFYGPIFPTSSMCSQYRETTITKDARVKEKAGTIS